MPQEHEQSIATRVRNDHLSAAQVLSLEANTWVVLTAGDATQLRASELHSGITR
ncbi:MAG: hypothetical protein R3E97_24335 [Candidatus Eisenbacteria bacterium]